MQQQFQDQTQPQVIVQKPVKYIENVYGRDIRSDKSKKNYDVESSFQTTSFGKDRMIQGSLPFATSPRLKRNVTDRNLPVNTTISRVCFNDCLNEGGRFHDRYWVDWNNHAFLPTTGDVTKDPRYGENTRSFTKPYLANSKGGGFL